MLRVSVPHELHSLLKIGHKTPHASVRSELCNLSCLPTHPLLNLPRLLQVRLSITCLNIFEAASPTSDALGHTRLSSNPNALRMRAVWAVQSSEDRVRDTVCKRAQQVQDP